MEAAIEKTPEGAVLLCAAEQREWVENVWEAFKDNPHDPKYQQIAWQSNQAAKSSFDNVSLDVWWYKLKQSYFIKHAGFLTLTIFIACWCIFLWGELFGKKGPFQLLHFYPEFNLNQILSAPHRLLGPALFHFSWMHIVFNTLWWWQLGGSIEKILGKQSLLFLLFISAVISNIGQFYASGPLFGGLSGVVYALVGYVWWMGWLYPKLGLNLSKPMVGFLLFWLVLGYVDLLPINMANTAHTLGLMCGCLMAWLKAKTLIRGNK